MSEPKKHHYVPICYSEHFANDEGFIFLADKWNDRASFATRPQNALKTNYLYRQPVHTERRYDNIFELHFSSEVESKWTPLYRSIVDRQPLSADRIEALVKFIALQAVRVPLTLNAVIETLRESVLSISDEINADIPDQLRNIYLETTGKQANCFRDLVDSGLLGVNIDPHRTLTSMPHLIQSIPIYQKGSRFGPPVFLHNRTNLSFISSDNPIIYGTDLKRLDRGRPYDVGKTGNFHFIFPISSRIAMVNNQFFRSRNQHEKIVDTNIVSEINRAVAKYAYRFLFSDQPLIVEKLAKRTFHICPRPISKKSVIHEGNVHRLYYKFGQVSELENSWSYDFDRP